MDENKWTASTNTSWIYFNSEKSLKIITGEGENTIPIYIEEATKPTTDVIGVISIVANGNSFDKEIKRCAPTVIKTEKDIDFYVNYSNVNHDNKIGPCKGGTSKHFNDENGISVENIKLTTKYTYSNGDTSETVSNLTEYDVDIYYFLNEDYDVKYSILPNNNDKERDVSVGVYLKSDSNVKKIKTKNDEEDFQFVQRGIKDENGEYILFDIDEDKGTGLTECNEEISF